MGKAEFQIVEHIGVLSDDKVATELNLVEWNGRKATYDLRRWKSDGREKMPYKGLTLSMDELRALRDILNGMEVLQRGLRSGRTSKQSQGRENAKPREQGNIIKKE